MALTLQQLNNASQAEAAQMLDGLYEHSPWIAEQALNERPFTSLAHLKHAMCEVLAHAGRDAQLGLIRAHPELAGKAMVSKSLTAESTNEQTKAGLTDCTPEEFAKIQKLNADYNAKFGWPFILAVRGPRGVGLSKKQIIDAFERRLFGHPDMELQECLRNIHRIAEIRLNDKFGAEPTLGHRVWDWQEQLAQHSDPGFAELGQLTVTYLTDAHRACAQRIMQNMRDCGFDEVYTDAVGNVVGRYHPATAGAKYLMTGSHYDTVRNGGKYDGRLGIFVPMACVQQLHQQAKRLPFGIEVVAFAEEEGQRYKATFLGSGALIGQFNPVWLDQQDADGITMRSAMQHAGLCIDDIPKIQRDPAQYLGFIEVHIEQRPGAQRSQHPAGRGHVDQRQRALPVRGLRHRQPRGHHPHGPPPRRGLRRGRIGALHGTTRRERRRQCGHHGPAASAQWLDQRGARPLPVQPGHARAHRCATRRAGGRCNEPT
jgi:beta-ureidopropionase / N-carbamoyl-L-amino-acid hydrolase